MSYSSPTLSTALMNLNPAFTFILAALFRLNFIFSFFFLRNDRPDISSYPILSYPIRMEEVNFTKLPTIAKSLGTIISISGAFIITLYKGTPLLNPPPRLYLLSSPQNWVLAGLLLVCAALAFASCSILQVLISFGINTKKINRGEMV